MKTLPRRVLETGAILFSEFVRFPCRECRSRVRFLDDVCPVCGTYGPVQIPCPAIVRLACLSMVALVAIRITTMLW